MNWIKKETKQPEDRWMVVDVHTKLQVGKPCTTRAGALRKVDRLDNEYGAYRYYAVKLDYGMGSK